MTQENILILINIHQYIIQLIIYIKKKVINVNTWLLLYTNNSFCS